MEIAKSDGDGVGSRATQQPQQAPTFTIFRRLPPELRRKVWRNAMMPRFMELTSLGSSTGATTRERLGRYPEVERVPSLFLVSKEAHAETRSFYKRINGDIRGPVLFSHLDIICLRVQNFLGSFEAFMHANTASTLNSINQLYMQPLRVANEDSPGTSSRGSNSERQNFWQRFVQHIKSFHQLRELGLCETPYGRHVIEATFDIVNFQENRLVYDTRIWLGKRVIRDEIAADPTWTAPRLLTGDFVLKNPEAQESPPQ
jgi:hypothetical protein